MNKRLRGRVGCPPTDQAEVRHRIHACDRVHSENVNGGIFQIEPNGWCLYTRVLRIRHGSSTLQSDYDAAEFDNRSSAAASGLDGSDRNGNRERTTRFRRQSACRSIRNNYENAMVYRLRQIFRKTMRSVSVLLSMGRSALIEFFHTWQVIPEDTFR